MATPVVPSLKQLEALHWVAQLGTFQAAAARLNTTQSAVSKRIAELEASLGQPLFERSGRASRLNAEGSRVAAAAAQMLALGQRMIDEIGGAETATRTFRLGASELIGVTWLPRYVQRLRDSHPDVRLEIEIDHGGRLLERLGQGRYDLALIPGPMWGRLFEHQALRTLERCWMASPSLGVPRHRLTLDELSNHPIASQFPDTIHAQLQRAWFQRHGQVLRHTVYASGFAAVGAMVLAGLAVGQLPVGYYAQQLREGRLVKLKTDPELPNLQYFAVYRRNGQHVLAPEFARKARRECDFFAVP
jgi:DNA-binding transcriptional LysR family regulator